MYSSYTPCKSANFLLLYLLEKNVRSFLIIDRSNKYKYPEVVDWLDEELRAANTEFFHLSVGKKSGVLEEAEFLDGLLEDAYAHLADTCERILFNIDDYFKNIKNN